MLLPMKADRRVQRVQGQPLGGILVSPSFLWKEVPRRGGGWLPQTKKKWVEAFPRFVIPSAAEGSFSFPVFVFLRKAICMKHRDLQLFWSAVFPVPPLLTAFFLTANEKDFSRSLEMTLRESDVSQSPSL